MYRKFLLASACLVSFGISEASAKWSGVTCFAKCTRFSCKKEATYEQCKNNCAPKSIVACTGSAQLQPWFLKKPIGIGGDVSGLKNKLNQCLEENKQLKEQLAHHESGQEGEDFQWHENPLYEGSRHEEGIGEGAIELSPEELTKDVKQDFKPYKGNPIIKHSPKQISSEELTKDVKPKIGIHRGKPLTVKPSKDEGDMKRKGPYGEQEFYDEFNEGDNPNIGGKYKIGFPEEVSGSGSLQALGKAIQKNSGLQKNAPVKKQPVKKSQMTEQEFYDKHGEQNPNIGGKFNKK
jgi:hypothetical protein